MNQTCRICENTAGNKAYECREKMFGWGDAFPYFQCGQCGCLQIADFPTDLGRYYPKIYYSFASRTLPRTGLKARLAAIRDYAVATGQGSFGKWVNRFMPAQPSLVPLGRVPLTKSMRILDVGCGSGLLLNYLDRAGFESLAGVDPFLPNDVQVSPKVRVRKLPLAEVKEQYDLIMLHHVFEHLESGLEMLEQCRGRLSSNGKLLLRFPTCESDAWEEYRENWVGLDAPRHLFLHTRRSLELLAGKAGLKIEQWFYDSFDAQFWASELYRRGKPLHGPDGTPANPLDYFSPAEMKQFAERSETLNRTGRGDQVVAILSPAQKSDLVA